MNGKIIAGIGAGIAIVIIVVSIFAFSNLEQNGIGLQTISRNEKLGLVINTPTSAVTIQQLDEIYEDAASTGIGRSNVYLFWNMVEPQKGMYNFHDTDVLMSLNKKNDLKVTLYFSIINGKTLGPFPDWMGKPRLHAISVDDIVNILDVLLSRYNIIDTVIIGGGIDAHFRYEEELMPTYKDLFNNVYEKIKEKHPNVKIGNSFSLNSVMEQELEHIVSELSVGDFVAFTYFPVDSLNEIVKTPSDARADLEKIFELVPDKKISLFELSWSTSDFVGGNEEDQADFIPIAYDFYNDNESKIEFFTWYRQYDRPERTCEIDLSQIEGFIGIGTSEFVAERLGHYICNAGLIDVDGKPKPAWNEFEKVIRQNQ
ncbi:MAG TPA: hypothetical protein VLC72_05775 [Nitrosopumilaceae archaeon]|nr:hypothetical protein [Nitrosopumilaceae archaeon]